MRDPATKRREIGFEISKTVPRCLYPQNAEYLHNSCAELDEGRIPRKGSRKGPCDQKSERTAVETCEIQSQGQNQGRHPVLAWFLVRVGEVFRRGWGRPQSRRQRGSVRLW
ncbi:hypothetical protein M404DRAFT_1007318 [Pisolithus tinctorius Marx 270]|uniref:Uncharacterized protein n=1 Tax=Pisolithus tinctorius Marx 270 TaxID=870435 RepID=A0A0C3JDH0_PISTI|nr:hypothetical protein M404DRAFT_1007318 [Pisolithus tinctorius Marx 270]